jgi:hypothetical protein
MEDYFQIKLVLPFTAVILLGGIIQSPDRSKLISTEIDTRRDEI